ncbi:MAG TPA: hypothetical protein VFE70_08085 [Candidatus Elarobacter sp.]|jgi:hypothetical protein|nr:hypothetical protein [Candidatus Elarobacter sp.]
MVVFAAGSSEAWFTAGPTKGRAMPTDLLERPEILAVGMPPGKPVEPGGDGGDAGDAGGDDEEEDEDDG